MNKIKVGDYVKITGDPEGKLRNGFRDMCFEVLSTEGYLSELVIDTTKAGGYSGWGINLKDVEKIDPTDLELIEEGDIMYDPKYKEYSKVLGRCGRMLFLTEWYKYLETTQKNMSSLFHNSIDAFKECGFIRYVPEKEIEELTMEDVCKELGRTIKIKK